MTPEVTHQRTPPTNRPTVAHPLRSAHPFSDLSTLALARPRPAHSPRLRSSFGLSLLARAPPPSMVVKYYHLPACSRSEATRAAHRTPTLPHWRKASDQSRRQCSWHWRTPIYVHHTCSVSLGCHSLPATLGCHSLPATLPSHRHHTAITASERASPTPRPPLGLGSL